MAEEHERAVPPEEHADFESTPLTRQEYISALVHLYRGEVYRSNSGRIRLDNTTNWAVLTSAGLLTFSFREGGHSHWILLIGIALVSVFLAFEGRRFRMADLWRSRVRKIEENFYGPILRRDLRSPETGWGKLVAEDLFHPNYKITRRAALRVRLARNYWPIYTVLIGSWVVHVLGFAGKDGEALSWTEVRDHLATGLLPWWVPLLYLAVFGLGVLWVYLGRGSIPRDEEEHWRAPGTADDDQTIFDL